MPICSPRSETSLIEENLSGQSNVYRKCEKQSKQIKNRRIIDLVKKRKLFNAILYGKM